MNSTSSTSSKGSPLKAFGILLLLGILSSAGAYFYGLSQGRAALAAQKSESQTQIQRATGEAQAAKDEVVAINNRVRLLDAQNGLYRAAVALDRRNFGIANTALQSAASALGQVKESEEIPLARVQSLAAALQKTDINVAANLENQRARILAFAEQLEDLTAPAASPETTRGETSTPETVPSEVVPNDTSSESLAPDGSTSTPDGGTPTPDGSTPAPDALTQPANENAITTENAVSNALRENAGS